MREAHPLLIDKSEVESAVAQIWCEVLDIPEVGLEDNFFQVGGDSLLALEVVSRVRASLDVELPLLAFFEEPTVRYLALTIEGLQREVTGTAPIAQPARDEGAPLPLSSAQQRFWLLQEIDPSSYVYNEPRAVRIRGKLDQAALELSLNELYRRHDVLRAVFRPGPDGPVQIIGERAPLRLANDDLTSVAAHEREAAAMALAVKECQSPFDLATGPLLRTRLLRLAPEDHILTLVMHHGVTDGHTAGILLDELGAIYNGLTGGQSEPALPPVAAQYADYVVWEHDRIRHGELERDLAYWRAQLDGVPATLHLPTDYARPETKEHRGRLLSIELDRVSSEALKRLAQEHGTTLFHVMLAGLRILLCRWTGQEDFALGTVAGNRSRPQTERMVGCFINFLPLRERMIAGERAVDLLERSKQPVMDAFAHQECPFEKIVEAVNPQRVPGTNPIYNVALLMRNFPEICFRGDAFEAKVFKLDTEVALLDLRFIVSESPQGLLIECEFKTAFFKEETIRPLLDAYGQTLQKLASHPGLAVKDFEIPPQLREQAALARARGESRSSTVALPASNGSLDGPAAQQPHADQGSPDQGSSEQGSSEQDSSDRGCSIAIAATFTAEPIADSLQFWMAELGIASQIEFAPYNQVFQQLLDPGSMLHRTDDAIRVLLLRTEDWAGPAGNSGEERRRAVEDRIDEFARTLKAAARNSPGTHLVFLCPPSRALLEDPAWADLLARTEREIVDALGGVRGIQVVSSRDLFALYPVEDYEDEYAEKLGHIPYTAKLYSALGTMLARRIFGLRGQKYKVIALDCDGTLWSGICGEDGAAGVVVDGARRELQRFVREQRDAGMLLCLCSKNNPRDVQDVFAGPAGMLLTREDFAAERVNWLAKSENLRALAAELKLGLDSFIFIDDSPVECAEVEANCPEVLTLELPQDLNTLPLFLRHVWAFDHHNPVTEEDERRTELYRDHAERELLRGANLTLEAFIATLDLRIAIGALQPGDAGRVAQLTQRTNQFNASCVRRTEAEIERFLQEEQTSCLTVRVADRFGDYGLVGAVIFASRGEALWVDTLLLSCRALGRRVEHAMLDRVMAEASEREHTRLEIAVRRTDRNMPVLSFLESLPGRWREGTEGSVYELAVASSVSAQAVLAPAAERQVEAKQ